MPVLSCIMTAYNAEPYVEQATRSILDQSVSDLEFVVVNDGSRDETGAILDRLAAGDSRLRVIHAENRGICRALNAALAETTGEFVARMDADDISHPERFARQLAAFRADPGLVAVGTLREVIDAEGTPGKRQRPHAPARHDLSRVPPSYVTLVSSSSMIRGEAFRALGFRPYFKAAEDTDLWLRLAPLGRLAIVPEVLLSYRDYGDNISKGLSFRLQEYKAVAILSAIAREAGRPDPVEAGGPLDVETLLAGLADRIDSEGFALWHYARLLRFRRPDAFDEAARARLARLARPTLRDLFDWPRFYRKFRIRREATRLQTQSQSGR